jgi:hypothetical protein
VVDGSHGVVQHEGIVLAELLRPLRVGVQVALVLGADVHSQILTGLL